MRYRLQVEGIHEHGLYIRQERSGIRLILWRDIKGRKGGCFGVVFMGIHLGLESFKRKIKE
jgi:hypothetical protein